MGESLDERRLQKLLSKYLSISDLEAKAHKRLPLVAWEYLDSGTGADNALSHNLEALQGLRFAPSFMRGEIVPKTSVSLFGNDYQVPFGIAPIGFPGLIWPKAEEALIRAAVRAQMPFTLSTVGTMTPESVAGTMGDLGWFQLYPPRQKEIRQDLLKRATNAGCDVLVVTADVPSPSRRERPRRAGLGMPPKITLRFIWQALLNPAWTMAILRGGLPRLVAMDAYVKDGDMGEVLTFIRENLGGTLDWEYLKALRDEWKGPIVLKGVLSVSDAELAISIGIDGIGVSNHGGRQFDGAVAPIEVLPEIVRAVSGRAKVLYDGGVRSGLDVIRAISLGADFVLVGRPFMFGLAALGNIGPTVACEILLDDLRNNMMQLGASGIEDLKALNAITARA